jgi:hypothetical protein
MILLRRNHNKIVNNSNNHRNNPYNDQQTVVVPHNRLPYYLHGQNLIQAPVQIPPNTLQANIRIEKSRNSNFDGGYPNIAKECSIQGRLSL